MSVLAMICKGIGKIIGAVVSSAVQDISRECDKAYRKSEDELLSSLKDGSMSERIAAAKEFTDRGYSVEDIKQKSPIERHNYERDSGAVHRR